MMGMLAYWVHNLDAFAVHFKDNFGIRWYGIAYFSAFWIAYLFLKIYAHCKKIDWTREQQQNFLVYILLGVLLGGRLGYIFFYEWNYYQTNIGQIFAVWNGGMSSHGGFLGVVIALFIFTRRNHFNFLKILDVTVTLIPVGFFLGRLANFVNAEVVGTVTQVPWAVIFPGYLVPRHPSQLYEAFCEGVLLFIATQYIFWKKPWIRLTPGKLASFFLILYSVFRIFCEQYREPDAPLIYNFSRGTFYSIFMLFIGIIAYVICSRKKNP